jgi:hypothetical protein
MHFLLPRMKSTAKKDRDQVKADLPLEAVAVAAHNRIAFESPQLHLEVPASPHDFLNDKMAGNSRSRRLKGD